MPSSLSAGWIGPTLLTGRSPATASTCSRVSLKRLYRGVELANPRHGVKVFELEQLAVIHRHASDFERLLMLLGLNAVMALAEIFTLRCDEIEVVTRKRIRRKSGGVCRV